MMFGYATQRDRGADAAPNPGSARLAKRLADVRKAEILPYLRPDGKTQVTVRYVNGGPVADREAADLDPAPGRGGVVIEDGL